MTHLKPLPFTKDCFRYSWGEDDEPLCEEYIRKLNSQLVEGNKRINQPAFTKRKIIPPIVKLSNNDRAPQLKLEDNDMKVTGEKGYSMVRATHGINRGNFYYEVKIDSMPENTASRIGWSQCYSNLQAPLGYDHYGYSWRSRHGTKFHQAKGKSYDIKGAGYKQGDTIGCMIELPYGNKYNCIMPEHLPPSIKEVGALCSAKGKKDTASIRMLEEVDKPTRLNEMEVLPGSRISFYKNGQFVGVAYEDIFKGFYYPSISLYKNCTISVNFGPNFKFPPSNYKISSRHDLSHDLSSCNPIQDIVEISIIDNFLTDLLYIVDGEDRYEREKVKEKRRTKDGSSTNMEVERETGKLIHYGNKLKQTIEECIRNSLN